MRPLRVVGAAVLQQRGDGAGSAPRPRCLAVQRSETMNPPLAWEFPGGKIEPGEDPRSALQRELREELALEVLVGSHLGRGVHPLSPSHSEAGARQVTQAAEASPKTGAETGARQVTQAAEASPKTGAETGARQVTQAAEADAETGTRQVILDVYLCWPQTSAELELREHRAARWLSAEELDDVRWAPADVPILPALRRLLCAERIPPLPANSGGKLPS
ncbi:MAG: NUDIX domain-containing protein [Acidobacteriota bacterium]